MLVFDYETKADDVWIYLPALRKTRRIVSSQRSQSFMGSEFSYGDLNIPALDDFNYKLVKEEPFGGESVLGHRRAAEEQGRSPRPRATRRRPTGSARTSSCVLRGLLYDKDGKLLKEYTARDIKLLDAKNKRYRPMHMEMVNKQNGRKSVFESPKVTFSPNTKDEFFTPAYLERYRVPRPEVPWREAFQAARPGQSS